MEKMNWMQIENWTMLKNNDSFVRRFAFLFIAGLVWFGAMLVCFIYWLAKADTPT